MRVLAGLLVAFAVHAAAAGAQTTDTRNRAVIVLDASKSMNEDAGIAGTRLDAAKRAFDELVQRLPPGAPVGLRVYGSKVDEASRAEGCRDTELAVPVGPLDKAKLRDTVHALQGKGRTPIGASLLATPGDLGGSQGRRSVVLVSDGGDNCAPPNPCAAARRIAEQGVDLSISVVGLQPGDERYYAVDVPAGRRLFASVTAIPSKTAAGQSALDTELLAPDGEQLDTFGQVMYGADAGEGGRERSYGLRSGFGGADGVPAGLYRLHVTIKDEGIDPEPIPLELGVQLLGSGEAPALVREAGRLTGAPTPAPKPKATATPERTPADSGTSWAVVLIVAVVGLAAGLAAAWLFGRKRPT